MVDQNIDTSHDMLTQAANFLVFGSLHLDSTTDPIPVTPVLPFNDAPKIVIDGAPDLFEALKWQNRLSNTLHGRTQEYSALKNWLLDEPKGISVRLVSGVGGTGKTRLAAELAQEFRGKNWTAGFLVRGSSDKPHVFDLTGTSGLLLIIDYPEERMEFIRDLAQRIIDIPDHLTEYPIRILLLSRQRHEDWRELANTLGGRFGQSEIATLGELGHDQALLLIQQTAKAFAGLVGGPPVPDKDKLSNWLHKEASHRTPLIAMAAALHGVLTDNGDYPIGAHAVIDALVRREESRVSALSRDRKLGERGLNRLMALAALSEHGLTESEMLKLAKLEAVPLGGQQLKDALKPTPFWQQGPSGWCIPRLLPDRMAACFMARTLLDDPDHRLADWLFVPAAQQGGAFGGTLSRVLFDIMGGASTWRPTLDTALTEMLEHDPARILAFEAIAFQEPTSFSAGFAAKVITGLLSASDLSPDQRAGLLNNYANRLSELGDRQGALGPAQEALELRRQLAHDNPAAFTPDLASSLNNYAETLSELGDLQGALGAAQEALALFRQLAHDNPAAFTPDLALSLNTYALRLSDLGDPQGALGPAQEALELRRQLAHDNPAAFTPDLASSLNNYALRLSDLGNWQGALGPAQEALELYRQLAHDNPAAFTPNLARLFNNYSTMLSDLGDPQGALGPAQEALELRRQLAHDNPAAFTPDLASSLNNYASMLSDLGDRQDALGPAQEALELYRQQAHDNPAAFTPNLAASLHNYANRLSELGDRQGALGSAQEALELRRQLAKDNPAAFTPDLAGSLNNYALRLSDLGNWQGALGPSKEAVELYRQQAHDNPAAFAPDLAMSLNNYANSLSELGDRQGALGAAQEALALFRQLAHDNPAAFTPDLAMSLNTYALRLSEFGDRQGALGSAQQAVELRRQLAHDNPAAFTPDLASSLNNYASMLSDLGDRQGALGPAQEALELRRQLAHDNPVAFTPDLALSLNNYATMLSRLGDRQGALGAAQEAVRTLAPLFTALPDAYGQNMAVMAQNYIKHCEEAQTQVDEVLLGPIAETLQALQNKADPPT